VIQQSSEDGAIPDAFERVSRRGFQQFSSLHVAERRRTTFVTLAYTFVRIGAVVNLKIEDYF
jgi:hypothetical protein